VGGGDEAGVMILALMSPDWGIGVTRMWDCSVSTFASGASKGEMIPGISTSGILTAFSRFSNDRQEGDRTPICCCFLFVDSSAEQSWARSRRVGDERTCVESERKRAIEGTGMA